MNANFVPFGSLPGGILVLLLALIGAVVLVNIDFSGGDHHGDDDVS